MKTETSSPNSLLGIHAIHDMVRRRRGGGQSGDYGEYLERIVCFVHEHSITLVERVNIVYTAHSFETLLAASGIGVSLILIILFLFKKMSSSKTKKVRIVEPSSAARKSNNKASSSRWNLRKKSSSRQQASEDGCYLTYETDSGGRLMLHYKRAQQDQQRPKNAVGFWKPGKGVVLQDFKFDKNGGKMEIIRGISGGDSNRRKYFEGWCQYLKIAKSKDGVVQKFSRGGTGVEVDVYGFDGWESKSYQLNLGKHGVDMSKFDAVAVVPKHKDFLQGVTTLGLSTFLEKGSVAGASAYIKK